MKLPRVGPEPSRIRRSPATGRNARTRSSHRRECIALQDPTDCLLEAYDCVAQRAYDNFIERGPGPGTEMDDWLAAERQLLLGCTINVNETPDYFYAMASFPGANAARLTVGIESRWLVIIERYPRFASRKSDTAESEQRIDAGSGESVRAELPGVRPAHSDSPDGLRSRGTKFPRGAVARPPESGRAAKSACILELPAEIDASRSIAVLADGLLGIRMPKIKPRP